MTKIQINSLEALERLIGGDSELEIYKHIDSYSSGLLNQGHVKLIDGSFERVSGVRIKKQFCLPCYNKLLAELMEKCNEGSNNS